MRDAELLNHIELALDSLSHTTEGQYLRRVLLEDNQLTLRPWIRVASAEVTCSACPLQIEGVTTKGERFYYRSRHDIWRVELDGVTVLGGQGGYSYGANDDEILTFLREQGVLIAELNPDDDE